MPNVDGHARPSCRAPSRCRLRWCRCSAQTRALQAWGALVRRTVASAAMFATASVSAIGGAVARAFAMTSVISVVVAGLACEPALAMRLRLQARTQLEMHVEQIDS